MMVSVAMVEHSHLNHCCALLRMWLPPARWLQCSDVAAFRHILVGLLLKLLPMQGFPFFSRRVFADEEKAVNTSYPVPVC
jgi:hypothetical protein